MTTKIIWKNKIGEPFQNLQGNRQGGKGSTSDFKTYTVDNLQMLINPLTDCHIGSIYLGVVVCADDLILAANSLEELQIKIALANFYANHERFILHPTKSCMAMRGISKVEFKFLVENNRFKINDQPLTINNECTHLGVQYNMNNCKSYHTSC